MKAISIRVLGKVQGVAFRYYTKIKADELGLHGSVQNLEDGSVLIHAAGDQQKLNSIKKWCHMGSPASEVKQVITDEWTIKNKAVKFDIKVIDIDKPEFRILRH